MKILNILTEKRKTGNIGEDAAVKYLRKNHYKIIKRNFVASGYEIDIIAENKDTLAFIEVKTRTATEGNISKTPAASVTPEKQRRIIAAVKCYSPYANTQKYIGLDVIEVYLEQNQNVREIKHLKDAFNINTSRKRTYNY